MSQVSICDAPPQRKKRIVDRARPLRPSVDPASSETRETAEGCPERPASAVAEAVRNFFLETPRDPSEAETFLMLRLFIKKLTQPGNAERNSKSAQALSLCRFCRNIP
ncbi:MAG: hypothetical protein ACK58T_18600, partial [Phycisphaerae bacterium]